MILALDTATQFASIALHDGRQVLAELNWRSERRHTVELAPQVQALMALAEASPDDLTAIAVAIGPGSYTGTRVATSFAKGIVIATGLPLLGIPTLDTLAYTRSHTAIPLCALVAAGRGRYCWAAYDPGSGLPKRTSEWGLNPISEIVRQLEPPTYFIGELSPEDQQFLQRSWSEEAIIARPALALRRAGALAGLAWLRLEAGDVDDPVSLSPIYLG